MGPKSIRPMFLEEEEIRTQTTRNKRQPREDTVRRRPSASKGERPQKKPNLQTHYLRLPVSKMVRT